MKMPSTGQSCILFYFILILLSSSLFPVAYIGNYVLYLLSCVCVFVMVAIYDQVGKWDKHVNFV